MKQQEPTLPTSPEPLPSVEQLQELIRKRAYELYEQRGREEGHDLDDWIAAEFEVTRNFKA
jgi:Protein of unknown function (DUF2934)